MKKSILALGALTVVGGLCLAGSAQAVYYFGDGYHAATTNALDLNPGSMGNELIVPYFSAQGATHTNIDIVNTDQSNGKAVKVRFRGAANSDDVLDFTVLMSPGDVWNADISQDSDGLAHIKTTDKTCTLPSGPIDQSFIPSRFPGYMTRGQAAANTLEGYIEILNMADIPPKTQTVAPGSNANALYNAIKHSAGTPACAADWVSGANAGTDALQALLDTNTSASGTDLLNDYGLDAPTGGLTGGWALINQTNFAAFSANDTAVHATNAGAAGFSQVAIAPQIAGPAALVGMGAADVTADPLLTGYGAPLIPAVAVLQWYDIPDLSTPMLTGVTPTLQADTLAAALGKTGFNDEYINDANGPTPMSTDLIFSQPTRRYFAVVDYADSAAKATIIYNDNVTSGTGNQPELPYAGTTANARLGIGAGNLALMQQTSGPVACLQGITVKSYDQEETTASTAASFSPGVTNPELCGEVATMTWGNSPLGASLTNTRATTSYKSGWVAVSLPVGTGAAYGLPALGFSAINAMNGAQGYGITWGIRW